jgi:uncharacterized protein (TIGR00251 family)
MEQARIRVHLIPRARVNQISGERAGALLVRVTAPPADGRANAALCALIASQLGIARGRVTVVQGHTSRQKLLQVQGMDAPEVKASLRRRS